VARDVAIGPTGRHDLERHPEPPVRVSDITRTVMSGRWKAASVVRRSNRFLSSVALPVSGATMLAYALIGDISTGDHQPIIELDWIDRFTYVLAAIGAVGVVAALVMASKDQERNRHLGAVCLSSIYGIWLGISLRILSSHTYGANIGAGLVLVLFIPITIVMFWGASRLLR
jgi:hypothetical protein